MATSVAAALKKLLPKELPPSLSTRSSTLYQVLSRYPNDGVGQRIHQTRWSMKGISDSYWVVTKTRLKLEGKHGKAWGKLTWKGKLVSDHEEEIRGGLKYTWRQGVSRTTTQPSGTNPIP
ncbi:hypothetical protein BDY19DRAFT_903277 [Irpex rosettiformis]|uniref:Uncharacterized protein n=1 Tax=Irpex rosettiformis TaxID=378272 RepID=A0ACB8UDW3_9APHY|nr:hypothetical protein BDY19DRAFT_903277 [Irpex rosettiformis]